HRLRFQKFGAGDWTERSAVNRSSEKEMMDLPDPPKDLLIDDLRNLRIINRCLGNHRLVRRGLARLAEKQETFSLLDIGTGSGDLPAAIARWARRKGKIARISGLEPNRTTIDEAARQTGDFNEISLVRGDGMAPPFQPASFDFVLASQVLHHFSEEGIVALLRIWAQVARRGIIVSDLIRHPLAYHGIRLFTRLLTRNVMTLVDAPLSVRRGLTLGEWKDIFFRADVGTIQAEHVFPFRLLAVITVRP
ncbi:MAG: methyltransferase domain-containing protein, partial [Alphaproteobacteria bacterium]